MENELERDIAIQAELYFLLNLLVLPGVAFVALLLIARRHRHSDNPLTRCHLRQAMRQHLVGRVARHCQPDYRWYW